MPSPHESYPQSPEDIYPQGPLLPHSFQRKWRLVNSQHDAMDYVFNSRSTLLEATRAAIQDPIAQNAGTLFVVHAKGLLLRLVHWEELRTGEHILLPAVVVDIAERFHEPAILSLTERRGFNWANIAQWVCPPPEAEPINEEKALTYLCNRWT